MTYPASNEHLVFCTEKHMMGALLLQILMLTFKGLCNYKCNFYNFDMWIKQNIVVVSCSVFALLWMNIKHCNMAPMEALWGVRVTPHQAPR